MYNENNLFDLEKDKVVYPCETQGAVLIKEKKVPYFIFPSFEKFQFIRHGFSTRLGGVSQGEFGTLNLSYERGDHLSCVTKNYELVCDSMGLNSRDIVFSDQIHGARVYRAQKKDCQGNQLDVRKLSGIDGLVTDEKNIVLCTSFADCVPLFFVDPVKKAIGLSHSGWKGTVRKIGKKTVEVMQSQFKSNPEDIYCVIGPSICSNCYEVGTDVTKCIEKEFSSQIYRKCVKENRQGKFQLDLWKLNQLILMEVGILETNIEVSGVCTCCNNSLLFSHRASGGKRGNMCGFLSIIS